MKDRMRRIHCIHFVGIGGSGMGGIAEVLLNLGYSVQGSDLKPNAVTQRLTKLGAQKWSVAESQARVDSLSGQYHLSGAQSTQIEQLIRFAEQMQPDRVGLLRADRGVRELELKQSPKKFAADLANLLASADLNLSNAEQARLVTALRALDLNKAINLSKAEESGFMRKVNPYLPAASQVLQMIKSILSTGRN